MDDKRSHFEALVLPHLDAAYRLARWLARSPGDADDVVQEAFLRAFRAFDTLRSADARAWLLAIVRNCALSALEQQQRRAAEPLTEEHEAQPAAAAQAPVDPEGASIERDEQRTLARLIAALPPEHREVLLLRELEDLSYREIAAVTAIPIGTVMSRLARARAALRANWLEESRGEPRAVR